jgi:hypothetical protein
MADAPRSALFGDDPESASAKPARTATRRASAVMLSQVIEIEDNTLMGARPSKTKQEKLDCIQAGKVVKGLSSAHLEPTAKARFVQMTKDFPMHFLRILPVCILPILAGCIPVVVLGISIRTARSTWPNYIGTASDLTEVHVHLFSTEYFAWRLFDRAFLIAGYYLVTPFVMCTLWSRKALFTSVVLKSVLPFYMIHIVISWGFRFMQASSPCEASSWNGMAFLVQSVLVVSGYVVASCVTQSHTKQPGFTWMYSLLMVLIMVLILAYQYVVWPIVATATDMTLFMIGAIANPIVFELVLTYTRVICRTLPHAHESTVPCLMAVPMAFKKSASPA